MKALVIAGSCPQIVLMQQLKERGIHTILADNNINAVARPYADDFVNALYIHTLLMKDVVMQRFTEAIQK